MPRTVITTPRVVSRFMGGSTLFNGTTSTINCGATDIIGTGAVTVSAWIRPISLGGASVGRILDNGKFILQLITTNKLNFRSDGGSTNALSLDGSIKFAKWSHIIVSRNSAGQTTFYINGVINGSANQASGTPAAASSNTFIGNNTNANRSFDGKIAEVKIFNSALTAAQAQELYVSGSVAGVTPVASYALDDQPSTYIDSIGGNNGTGTNTTYSPDTPINQRSVVSDDKASLNFVSASSQYVRAATITPVPTLAVSAFATIFSLNFKQSFPGIITYGASNASFNWDLNLNNSNGKIQVDIQNSSASTTQPVSNTALEDNKWHTVGFTYNGTTISIYIDGKLDKTSAFSSTALATVASTAFNVGRLENGFYFNGKIKNARIWNTALTAQEIRDLHFSNVVPRTGLVGEWKLDEGAGTIAYDSSGNGNNGTITGATWSADTPSKARTVVGGNLVKNGDFSYYNNNIAQVATTTSARWIDGTAASGTGVVAYGWALATKGAPAATAVFDTSVSASGTASMKLSTLATGTYVEVHTSLADSDASRKLYQLPITAGASYTFSYKMKTNVVSGDSNSGAILILSSVNRDGTLVTGTSANYVKVTQDWTSYSETFTPGAGSTGFILRARIYGHTGAGTLIMDAWFDDITLTKTTPQTRTVV